MVVLRLVLVLTLLVVGAAGLMFLTTRDKRYLQFIPRLLRYAVLLLLGVAVVWLLERALMFL